MPRHDCHPLSNYCAFRLSASFWTESRDCTTAQQGATTMVACSFSNRSACGCTSPQPGTSTPSTHHGWGDLRLVWENSCGEKRKWRRRAASIVLHFLYMRGRRIDESIRSTPRSRVRGPLRNTIDGYDLARFGPIQWLEWENWVVVNAEICDN